LLILHSSLKKDLKTNTWSSITVWRCELVNYMTRIKPYILWLIVENNIELKQLLICMTKSEFLGNFIKKQNDIGLFVNGTLDNKTSNRKLTYDSDNPIFLRHNTKSMLTLFLGSSNSSGLQFQVWEENFAEAWTIRCRKNPEMKR